MSTQTNTRTIQTAAAELTAAGYETHITRDGWLCVYDGNDITWGDVPQEVFDIAYFETEAMA